MLFNSRTKPLYSRVMRLLAFQSRIGFASQIGRSIASAAEKAGEDRLEEGSEDNLGAVGDGESHPQDQDELEGVVKG
jgi:hypothetical protein